MPIKSRNKRRAKRKNTTKTRKKVKSRKRTKSKLKKYKLQPQKKNYDCALSCISMFSGIPYNVLKNKYFKMHDFNKEGVTQNTEKKILKSEGFNVKYLNKVPVGKPAIISVDSLNYPDVYHDIFWDGRKIYDPNIENKRKNPKIKLYKNLNNVDIVQILG